MSLSRVVCMLGALAAAGCLDAVDVYGTTYSCNCTADCSGQPVTSFSNQCGTDPATATARGVSACKTELASCPTPSCHCTCTEQAAKPRCLYQAGKNYH